LSCGKDTIIFKAIKKLRRAIIARRSLSLAEKYQIKFQSFTFCFWDGLSSFVPVVSASVPNELQNLISFWALLC
jgi:hypothetical protein